MGETAEIERLERIYHEIVLVGEGRRIVGRPFAPRLVDVKYHDYICGPGGRIGKILLPHLARCCKRFHGFRTVEPLFVVAPEIDDMPSGTEHSCVHGELRHRRASLVRSTATPSGLASLGHQGQMGTYVALY